MSSWKKRQVTWQQERKKHFGQHQDIVVDSDSDRELESELPNVRSAIKTNYRHIINQPHQDTISVLRVRVYNQRFYN